MLAALIIAALGRAFDVVDAISPKVVLWTVTGAVVIAGSIAAFIFIARRRRLPAVGQSVPITIDPALVEEMLSDLTPEEWEVVGHFQRDPIAAGWRAHKDYEEVLRAAGERWKTGHQRNR